MPTSLYFVRHGQTAANRSFKFSGQIDLPLTNLGKQQASACRNSLHNLHFDAVYCSPLTRARDTATLATSGLPGIPEITYDDRLIERDFGTVDGKFAPFAMAKVWSYDKSYTKTHYGEETLLHLEFRVQEFLDMIREKHPDQTILVFSHGGVGAAIHALLNDTTRTGNFFKDFHLENGALTFFTL